MRKYFGLSLGLIVLAIGTAHSAADIGSVTQSYNSNPSVLPGMIVELEPKSQNTVEPLASKDISHMLGIVVPVKDSPIVLTSPSAKTQQVLVAASGSYSMLVSNQSGSIKAGDYVTASALSGIGMEATKANPEIVGQAITGFNGTSNVLGSVKLKGSTGGNINVNIGTATVSIRLAPNPIYQKGSTLLPSSLSKTANSLANKQVSAARIYLGSFILLVSIVIASNLLYSGVRSGMTAVGRNPLAKKAIWRSLVQVIFSGLVIFMLGAVLAYTVLRF
jgi:hypothetical protein